MPDHRFSTDRFDDLRELTLEAAVEISRALGGPTAVVTADPSVAQPTG